MANKTLTRIRVYWDRLKTIDSLYTAREGSRDELWTKLKILYRLKRRRGISKEIIEKIISKKNEQMDKMEGKEEEERFFWKIVYNIRFTTIALQVDVLESLTSAIKISPKKSINDVIDEEIQEIQEELLDCLNP